MRFIDDLKYNWQHFGFLVAWRLIFWPRFLGHLGFKGQHYIKALLKLQRKMVKKTIDKYRSESIDFKAIMPDNYTIWTCWWQGEELMPEVVQRCHESLRRNANGHKVVLITKHNYKDFVRLPDWVLDKAKKNEISFSHLSDMIRLSLLSNFGGCWVDSALFVINPICIKGLFFMPRLAKMNDSICQGRWCFGVMAGPKDFKVFNYMLDCLLEYWSKHSAAIDYLMFDGFLRIAYEEYEDVHRLINGLHISSPDIHSSRYTFMQAVDEKVLDQLFAKNQFLSLTWRIKYPIKLPKGEETYYGALLKHAGLR